MSIARAAAATTTVVGLVTSGSLGTANAQDTTPAGASARDVSAASINNARWSSAPFSVAVPSGAGIGRAAATTAGAPATPCYPTRLV